jgi:hypothetical protein
VSGCEVQTPKKLAAEAEREGERAPQDRGECTVVSSQTARTRHPPSKSFTACCPSGCACLWVRRAGHSTAARLGQCRARKETRTHTGIETHMKMENK